MQKKNNIYWPIIFGAYISLFALGLSDNARGPLFSELLNQFHLSNAKGSLFFSVSSAMGIVGSLFAQKWIQKVGRLQSFRWSNILMGVGFMIIATSNHFIQVLIGAIFFGFCVGVLGVLQNVLVSSEADGPWAQRLLSGLHSMYGMASLLAPLLVSWILESTGKWQNAFFVCGSFSLIVGLGSFLSKGKPETFATSSEVHETSIEDSQASSLDPWKDKNSVLPKGFFVIAFAIAFSVVTEILVSTRLSLYMQSIHGWSVIQSARQVSLFFVCMLSGRLLFVFWHPKWNVSDLLKASIILTVGTVILGLWIHPLFLVLSGLSISPFYPLAMSLVARLFRQQTDRYLGIMVSITSLSIVTMHTMSGLLTDSLGIQWALWVGPIMSGLSLLLFQAYPGWLGVSSWEDLLKGREQNEA